MTQKGIINNFTEGSITKQLLLFSVPFMLSNGMQVLYSLVDMIIVGQFVGSYGLSAMFGLLAIYCWNQGFADMYADDIAQLEAGMGLYDAFYRWCRDATEEGHGWPTSPRLGGVKA